MFQKWFKGSKICNVVRQHGFYPNNKYTGWIVKKKQEKGIHNTYFDLVILAPIQQQ